MSESLSWLLETAILPGQLQNFQAIGAELITATEAEPATLAHEWYLSEDQTTYQVYARYRDSAAALAHLKTFHPFMERLLKTSHPVRFQVYGVPTDEVKAALALFEPVYFTRVAGINR